MQKKLETLIESQLIVRVSISRGIHIFTERELAEGFGMSISTLRRYTSPQARELSREHARKQTEQLRVAHRVTRGKCYRCKHSLAKHLRCHNCGILIHEGDYCGQNCIDAYHRRKMKRQRVYA